MEDFDPKRAMLRRPDFFQRLVLRGEGTPLVNLKLDDDAELLILERKGKRHAFSVLEMTYHHVAQGELEGEAVLLAFCGICHSAMGFDPVVDGRVLHLSAGGLYDGIIILTDDETRSYWNHITGECVYGELRGKKLSAFSVDMTSVSIERDRSPQTAFFQGKPSLVGRFMKFKMRKGVTKSQFMPFFFGKTMGKVDSRAEKMEQGLGVIVNGEASFFPASELNEAVEATIGGLKVKVQKRPSDKVPEAVDESGERPMQLFCRWYGFSATYPECQVFRN